LKKSRRWSWPERIVALFMLLFFLGGLVLTFWWPRPESPTAETEAVTAKKDAPVKAPTKLNLTFAKARDELNTALDQLQDLQAQFPKADVDRTAKADQLGADTANLFAFVRDEVAFEIYPGVLRGARGTFLGRAGNAFDKCLLLSDLLKSHGLKTRFVRGTLTENNVQLLLHQAQSAKPVVKKSSAIGKASPAQQKAERDMQDLLKGVSEDQAFIEKMLAQAKQPAADEPPLAKEVQGHCWLEVWLNGHWVALDPSFPGAKIGDAFAVPESIVNDLPADLFHSVTIRVRVEKGKDDVLKMRTVLEKTWPTADLAGAAIQFYNVPDKVRPDASNKMPRFLPVLFVDGKEAFKEGFDMNGDSVPPEAFVKSEVAEAIERVGDVLAPDPKEKEKTPAFGLTGQWVDFEVRGPGQQPRIHTRTILDRIDPNDRRIGRFKGMLPAYGDPQRVRNLLFTYWEIGIEPGFLNMGCLVGPLRDHISAARDVCAAQALPTFDAKDPDASMGDRAFKSSVKSLSLPVVSLGLANRAAGLMLASQQFPDCHFYYATPGIVIFKQQQDLGAKGEVIHREGFDIVANSFRVINAKGAARARTLTMSLGILQTRLELLLQASKGAKGEARGPIQNTVAVLDEARKQNVPLILLDGAAKPDLASLAISVQARHNLKQELDSGFLVIVPTRSVQLGDKQFTAWWRIDPASGTTLGVIESGEGAALNDYVLLLSTRVYNSMAYRTVVGTATYLRLLQAGATIAALAAAASGDEAAAKAASDLADAAAQEVEIITNIGP